MTDRPPSFTPQNGDNDNRFNQPKSFAPKNDLDKTNRTTTPVTQIQRVSGEVDLSKLQNNSLQKPKVKLSKIKSLPQFLKIIIGLIIVIIIFLIIVLIWANSLLKHENALSSKADTSPAITYLIAGSDKRDNAIKDDTQGGRSDSIMLLTLPKTGTPSLISIPRDSYVEIAGYGMNKLNAAYSFGGPKLMVNTIETNFNIKIDHFMEMGFDGLLQIVDSVGKLHLCLDYNVNDNDSGLKWTKGCHDANGGTALAFSRMRYADPLGDIGRTSRQRQVINQLGSKIYQPSVLLNPFKALSVINTGLNSIAVDEYMNIFDVIQAFLGFKNASGSQGAHGTLPIKSLGYNAGAAGNVVLLDDEALPEFWHNLFDGSVKAGEIGGLE